MRRFWAFLAVALVAACAELDKAPAPPVAKTPSAEAPATPAGEPKLKDSTLKLLAARNLKPHVVRPLNVKSSCAHKDEIGTTTKLDLLVAEAEVKAFNAEVSMKGRGTCRFSLDDFEQSAKSPQALLRHRTNKGCSVRLWEEGANVTIAFNSCPKSCEGDAFNYLWPILVEAKSGRCF